MHGSMRLYCLLPRGELKSPRFIKSPSLGDVTPPLSHLANESYDMGLSFSMRKKARFSRVLIRNSRSHTKLLTPFTQLAD